MTKWVCTVCGYVYEGEAAPAECPVCHVGADKFKKVEGDLTLAAEHEYGVYAKTVKNNPEISDEDKKYIFDQLKANFEGECSEVGMYLCMARIAHREGYPEVGLYWEKAAYEEAEHAAKFAELLGEDLEPNMKATTKDNLKWRVDCEFGATAGKYSNFMCLRTFSKAYGLAGLRVGYAVGSAGIMRVLGKTLLPYHVNAWSLAVAEEVYRQKDLYKEQLETIIEQLGKYRSYLFPKR